jgi:hypothetical protein
MVVLKFYLVFEFHSAEHGSRETRMGTRSFALQRIADCY